MTIIGPLLMAALMIVPAFISQIKDTEVKNIAVIDTTNIFQNVIKDTKYLKFDFLKKTSLSSVKKNLKNSGYYAILYIPYIRFNTLVIIHDVIPFSHRKEAHLKSFQCPGEIGLNVRNRHTHPRPACDVDIMGLCG